MQADLAATQRQVASSLKRYSRQQRCWHVIMRPCTWEGTALAKAGHATQLITDRLCLPLGVACIEYPSRTIAGCSCYLCEDVEVFCLFDHCRLACHLMAELL